MTIQLTRTPSAVRVVLQNRLYRGSTIALFLSGLGTSAAAPQIAQFLVRDLGSSLTVAGLYYLTNLTAPIAGYLIGRRSDRTGRRLGLFRLSAVAGALGWLAIAFSGQLWMPFVISAVILGFAGSAASQLFAAIHDELAAHPTPNGDGVVSIVRMALTFGWVIGPVAGSYLAAQSSLRVMLVATAACTLAQIVPLGRLREDAGPARAVGIPDTDSGTDSARPHVPLRAMAPLLAFTGLFILVYAGEPIKYAYLPIYMNEQLHFPAALSGAIIGIQPLVELALMPVAVVVARRMGMIPLMAIGALFGVGANLLFATTGTAVGLFAGQVLMGGVWGVFAGLGIIVAQRLLPTAIATASAIFITAPALSSALGGLVGGIGAGTIGLPLVFVIPAVFALIASIGLVALHRRVGSPDPQLP
ncbi:MFS transporter [Diaminobutyricibacter tongyongensis]|uniref:MFS transporter n=1 Tax=Leifsonia tongyongensis TaxID=1268043 RepID=A0A6L9XVH7_9MICO|nr:MFS transporter [Diaminobutyricibacter tongyongensis]NEN05383.1 MFS transporter [Diaminobutyricibacter tongyongensis]